MSSDQVFETFLATFKTFRGYSPKNAETLRRDTSEIVALKIFNQFRLTLERSVKGIDDHLPKQNWEELGKLCHKLASSAELVGFEELGRQSRTVMEGAKAPSEDVLTLACENVRDNCRTILAMFEKSIPELKSFV